ncbi:MAG: integron integrase, partial [Deltaproteobacteria bacterium]|nr:integron integrase [Deltaproteobacteria bacterium]
TEQSYCDWIMRYIRYHGGKAHPRSMGKREIEAFLSHLAVQQDVAASTQRQALNAIVFLYKRVLHIPVDGKLEPVRAKRGLRPPVVMSQREVADVLGHMQGPHLLMAKLLYGSGLRLMECIRLRVRDLDFERKLIYVRAAKGGKDRTTLFPESLHPPLKSQVQTVKKLHDQDILDGYGEVYVPGALSRKYPAASKSFGWRYLFPSKRGSVDPRSGKTRRHHVLESGLQKAVRAAVDKAGITKPVGCRTFRHCFATHLLENGVNIRVVQAMDF